MQLKPGQLKVFYKMLVDEPINPDFERDIEKVLKKHGYESWASGFCLVDGVRDIAFDKRTDGRAVVVEGLHG